MITGAALGIGAAITNHLLSNDARVVLVDLSGAELKAQQQKHGDDRVQYLVGDVSQDIINKSAVEKAISTWGKLDALVLNAGIMAPVHRLEGADVAAWERIFRVNLCSQVSAVRQLPTASCKKDDLQMDRLTLTRLALRFPTSALLAVV
jgi:NADP-dependent 3-hydroxy acid dehydrogenase YdfG